MKLLLPTPLTPINPRTASGSTRHHPGQNWIRSFLSPCLFGSALSVAVSAAEPAPPNATDFTEHNKVLYVVPYAHLDTQWRWTYITTIDQFIKNTIDDNLVNFEKIPENTFTFTGSIRYEMMKEYYPEGYAKVKELIKAGRWHVGGSSVDENDANAPSTESLYRQILYGNAYFRREFGKESIDFMLPDCFGFQAHLPSVFAHAGMRGFSTQKLEWGLPFPIPFSVGFWRGPDGKGVIAAFDGTDYTGKVKKRLDNDPKWIDRVNQVGKDSGLFVDYRYFGVGDRGGAPRPADIAMTLASRGNPDSKIDVRMTSSDQMFRDLPKDAEQKMKSYQGDLLLTKHSAGSITSQAAMKRWNRQNEQLAFAAEGAAVAATWLGGMTYPAARLEAAWYRVLGSQMHDIMPGTSLPKAYELSWNDEVLALNQFAGVLEQAAGSVIGALDTRGNGVPLVVHNALIIAREDVVEATVEFPGEAPAAVSVTGPDGVVVPAQVLSRQGNRATIAVLANVAPTSWTTYHVAPAAAPEVGELKASTTGLESARYRLTVNAAGDVASIVDITNNRELLAKPIQLQFQYNKPKEYPAWNMDWTDQEKPPQGVLAGPVEIRVVEAGPVRVTLEIRRQGRDSLFTQRVSLSAGAAGERVEFRDHIDWQGQECALKAAFPLTVSNPNATYNLGLGVASRPTNSKDQYEVPHHQWFDLTAADGSYGVSILEDSKFGSDKPSDDTLRLTLIYTPGVRNDSRDQYSQDWGRHDVTYGLYGHIGDWRNGSEWQGRRLNQPLRAFQTNAHPGSLGKTFSFCALSSPQIDVRAIKRSEDGTALVVRFQELHGKTANSVAVTFAGAVTEAFEADAQERRIGPANINAGRLMVDAGAWSPKTFVIKLAAPSATLAQPTSIPVTLPFDTDVVSTDAKRSDGAFDGDGRSYPAEQFPATVSWNGIDFTLGQVTDAAKNALTAKGQRIALPAGDADQVVFLAAATEQVDADFTLGGTTTRLTIPAWTGFIGQWDNRVWDRTFKDIDYECKGLVTGITPGFINREPVAWFSHHRHTPKGNEAYRFTYLFARTLPLASSDRTLVLPNDPRIRIFALSLAKTGTVATTTATPLYDERNDKTPITLRVQPMELTTHLKPVGMTSIDRKETWEALSMGAPPSSPNGINFRVVLEGPGIKPNLKSGMGENNTLPRLNDGAVAQHDDDAERNVWFDGEGRFFADLQKSTSIARVNTYSWRKGAGAIQRFTLWGANGDAMPDANFHVGVGSGWTLLAKVDSTELGAGGHHGSTAMASDGGALGPFRWLLWIAMPDEATNHGTFFSEISLDLVK